MPDKLAHNADPVLACHVCLSEIPGSVASSLEGHDYVLHYCGTECYAEWERRAAAEPAGISLAWIIHDLP